jgi:hypothetical protein
VTESIEIYIMSSGYYYCSAQATPKEGTRDTKSEDGRTGEKAPEYKYRRGRTYGHLEKEKKKPCTDAFFEQQSHNPTVAVEADRKL